MVSVWPPGRETYLGTWTWRQAGLSLFSPPLYVCQLGLAFPGSRKPLSGISAGGNRCRRAGNRSLLYILATIAAGGHSSSQRM
ncbi:hypothetical protein CesoFtcFv8_008814 [Champsocephalus esox]|uniref:Uncharacterized protein n=1 Tax=Champsocephalus esox TaxID=159716 RepID=A0AAN8CD12_9TELE|nr:hypothetical protein CesoFtcFv8_008814 [Champsocephalus esox]